LLTILQTWAIIGALGWWAKDLIIQPHPVEAAPAPAIGAVYDGNGFDPAMSPDFGAGGVGALGDAAAAATSTPIVVQLEFITATPAAVTATPAAAPDDGNTYDAAYSYYDPSLGGVNCHSANWDGMKCADTTASGIKWSEYMGSGVAFPIAWLQVLGYGSEIQVIDPAPIAGVYTVIDICCGCDGRNWGDGVYRIDFLNDRQALPWAAPVKFWIISRTAPVEGLTDGACIAG